MNKQQAIEKLEQEAKRTEFTEIDIEIAISVIEQIEEPELPVVPQFVADWIDKQKKLKNGLLWALIEGSERELITNWLLPDNYQKKVQREDLLLTAFLDGYTIESEKSYIVEKDRNGFLYDCKNQDGKLEYRLCDKKQAAATFSDEKTAKLFAELINGKVEEVPNE